MKLMLKISIVTILSLVFTITHAQFTPPVDGVNIQASTDSPKPGDNVEVSIESYGVDLTSSSIVWQVNGKTQDQGVGMVKTKVLVSKIGVPVTVTAIIKTSAGREITKSIILKAGSVDMIWESKGYTPPFFAGKLPYSYQNTMHIIAVPHLSKDGINEIDPKTLIYKWKSDGKYIDNAQGYGKQSVDIESSTIPKPLVVSVEVYNREQTQSTVGNLTLEPNTPSVSFYEEDLLYGVLFNTSLQGKVPLKNSEMRVRAVPYGFNINSNDTNNYIWSINNIEQSDLIKNQSITIRSKENVEGSTDIGLEIRNMKDILQSAQGGFTVYFNKKVTKPKETL